MENLRDLLSEQGLRPKHLNAGSNHRLECPKCHAKDEDSFSLTVDQDGMGATGHCFRGSCGWTYGGNARALSGRPQYARPMAHPPADMKRGPSLYEFFKKRGIEKAVVDSFGLYEVQKTFRVKGESEKHPAIVFPYLFRGEEVNRKYRALHDKRLTMQEKQPLPTLFNVDSIADESVVLFVEGEPDVLALRQAGYIQVVSLKDGARKEAQPVDDARPNSSKAFAALDTHADLLGGIKKFILAGDMDEPGKALTEELARRLGRHRCWTVAWPAGCKDANDVLRDLGGDVVRDCIDQARPYPIEGVHAIDGQMLDNYLELPPPATLTTGIPDVDKIMSIPGEGRVIVITGFPNGGKTPFTMNLMVHLMKEHDRKFLVFSPEMQPMEEFMVQMSEILVGKPARSIRAHFGIPVMSRDERVKSGDWLNERMRFLSSDAEEKIPTLDWILDRGKDCALRMGITDVLIDPFNELEQGHGREMSETQFIGQCLQRANAFALRHGCNVWIVAHPAKPPLPRAGEAPTVPNGYSINGSAHWFNKCTLGITVHRLAEKTQIHVWKAKFRRLGNKGGMAEIGYDTITGRYKMLSTPDSYDNAYARASRGS